MKTGFYCEYELKDTTAIADSTLTTAYNSSFADISKAKSNAPFADYGTLEEDYFLLDGSMDEFPDTPDNIVYFSNALSGTDGTFENNPVIHILFTEHHTSVGIKFYFVGDHPLQMQIRWYGLDGILKTKKKFDVDSNAYLAWEQVEDYGSLQIEFLKAKPHRYVKFYYIEYGTDFVFGDNGFAIKEGKLIEEIDTLSDKLSINKLSYKVIDENNDFNTGNMSGLHRVMQKGQKMRAFEKVDDKRVLLGRYFFDSEKTDKNVTSISAMDYMGLLDNYSFSTGKVYNGELAGTVIDEIMAAAGVGDHTVDEETKDNPLYGWLKKQTCRKALREVLFACGSVVDTSRSETINIFKTDRLIQSEVKRERKFSTATELDSYVSDVSIKIASYTMTEEVKEIAKGNYPPGIHTIAFNSPYEGITIDNGSIVEAATNYVIFEVQQASDIVISGKKYDKEDLTVTSSVPNVKAGESRSAKSYSCALLDLSSAKIIADKILDYYNLQLLIKIRFLNEGDKVADWGEIYNASKAHGNFVAGFEKMTTDLTGGFISTADLRGYYKLLEDYYYTGEIYAGEEMGI